MEPKESCFCLLICVLMSLTCFCASVPNFNVIFFSVYRPKLLVVAQHPVEVLCHLFVGNFVLLNGSLLSEAVFLIVGHLRNALEFINQACTPHIWCKRIDTFVMLRKKKLDRGELICLDPSDCSVSVCMYWNVKMILLFQMTFYSWGMRTFRELSVVFWILCLHCGFVIIGNARMIVSSEPAPPPA